MCVFVGVLKLYMYTKLASQLSGVPPIVPELKGDDDTSYFDDIEQDDHSSIETFPTPTVSMASLSAVLSLLFCVCQYNFKYCFTSFSSIVHRHLLVTSYRSLDSLTMKTNSEHADHVIHSYVT